MKNLVENSLKLGFGLMRLPRLEDKSPDIEQVKDMVDRFLAAGGRYFDTAYIYGNSESVIGEALCARHPRESYYLASKLNAGAFVCKTAEDAKKQIHESLRRTGAGHLDFYLLHSLEEGNKERYDSFGLWDYMKELKAQGLIRHWGFSFHDSPELLDVLLTEHPDAEFVQLQINWADWEDPNIQSRKCYEVAARHGKPVVVMEPVKGGTLASVPPAVADVFRTADPDASFSSWAIRFAASLPNVMMVLSGMSTTAQMDDNLSYMKEFKPLSEEESQTILAAREALMSVDRIPCTACHYCTPGCPMGIHIPEIFNVMNLYKMYNNLAKARSEYNWRPGGEKASACIGCGQCEDACPQHLPVISLLKEVAETLE